VGVAQLGGTVQDLLTYVNNSAANVYAEISADGRSLNIYSRLSGPTMTITENGPAQPRRTSESPAPACAPTTSSPI